MAKKASKAKASKAKASKAKVSKAKASKAKTSKAKATKAKRAKPAAKAKPAATARKAVKQAAKKASKAAATAKPARAKPVKPSLPSFPAGMQMVYGIGIGDALAAAAIGRASPTDLVALRDQARSIVGAQGDLVAALKDLDAEIARRGVVAPSEPVVERFVAEIDGVALPAKVRDEIEQAIQQAAGVEIARIDTGGDMVDTPLAKLGKFGDGIGSRTPGRYLVNKNLNLG